jgi:hypothetical protein
MMGGEYHWGGWDGEVGGTITIGIGGGVPGEGHHFVEVGTVVESSDIISPSIIADYWGGVAKDFWNWLTGGKKK